MIKAQCNCGAVEFEINTDISEIFMCHCTVCRKSTGTHGVAVVIVENDAFRWLRGEGNISTWRKPNEDWQTSFCKVCGSFLPGINDELHMYIPAGLITGADETLKVTHHIWVSSKAPWYEICDMGKQHLKSFRD